MSYPALEAQILTSIARATPLSDAEFNTLVLDIYRYQREANRPYDQFCHHQGVPTSLDSWRDIPAVPTSAFRHATLRTFSEEETRLTFRTSGTTGEGFGSHHFLSPALYDASILRGWAGLALPPLPQVLLIQKQHLAPHSSLSHMMGTLGSLAPQSWTLDAEGRLNLGAFRAAVAKKEPVLLLGTALAFLHLFETLGSEAIPLPAGSLAMETGGYKGTGRSLAKEELYAMFERHLGLPSRQVLNEYSMTELSSQWYTRGLNAPHIGPHWTRALLIDPETGREAAEGERGFIRLFDLANLGSVLAIQTQDIGIRVGDGFILLGRDPSALPRGCSRAADEQMGSE